MEKEKDESKEKNKRTRLDKTEGYSHHSRWTLGRERIVLERGREMGILFIAPFKLVGTGAS